MKGCKGVSTVLFISQLQHEFMACFSVLFEFETGLDTR